MCIYKYRVIGVLEDGKTVEIVCRAIDIQGVIAKVRSSTIQGIHIKSVVEEDQQPATSSLGIVSRREL